MSKSIGARVISLHLLIYMSNSKQITGKQLQFKLTDAEIDYFKLQEEYFQPDFEVKKYTPAITEGQHVVLPAEFEFKKVETVVFNMQVGKGKTTLCYDLIEQFDDEKYCVIVCSPFIKLVQKDYEEIKERVEQIYTSPGGDIKGRPIKVFKYDEVGMLNDWGVMMKDVAPTFHTVHVMTVNCLLGNSGSDEFEQAFSKSDYLQQLITANREAGKRVVIVVDELHESIGNFKPTLIPNLMKWKGLVDKVIISSATFTPATVPVIKAFALLTDSNISMFESAREKNAVQAKIHLHVCNPIYNTDGYLPYINQIVKQYRDEGKTVDIISYSKKLAEKIYENKGEFDTLSFNSSDSKLLTADTEDVYTDGFNNIGTTFKTGVNITNPDGVLVVVFPSPDLYTALKYYGIFHDGIPAVIQAIGRLRNGGDIHLLLSEPECLIGKAEDYPSEINSKAFATHLPVNNSYDITVTAHEKLIEDLRVPIQDMERGIFEEPTEDKRVLKKHFGFWYPNLHEYLLTDSLIEAMKHENVSFGGLIAPYVIWSCFYNQFINATLSSIHYYGKPYTVIQISEDKAGDVFSTILRQNSKQIEEQGYRKSIDSIASLLSKNKEGKEIRFDIRGQIVLPSELVNKKSALLKIAMDEVLSICAGEVLSLTKHEYLKSCVIEAEKSKKQSDVVKAYKEVASYGETFIKWLTEKSISDNGQLLYDKELYTQMKSDFVRKVIGAIKAIKKSDIVFKNKAISLIQDNVADQKKAVFALFVNLFAEALPPARDIKGKKHFAWQPIPKPVITPYSGLVLL